MSCLFRAAGTQLPSLGAVMEAVDARGAEDATVAAEGKSKMDGVMSAELPTHPQMREGILPNGLRYIILNNQSPPERFEAHLEVGLHSRIFAIYRGKSTSLKLP